MSAKCVDMSMPALAMAAYTSSASARQPAITPNAMMENALGGQCAVDVRPTVGRSAATPHSAAGTRTDPPPSMPGARVPAQSKRDLGMWVQGLRGCLRGDYVP